MVHEGESDTNREQQCIHGGQVSRTGPCNRYAWRSSKNNHNASNEYPLTEIQGGGIRGFLNDGTTSFKGHQHLEQVAFGHCDYSYRNLGRPTRLQLQQDSTGFEVTVDGRRCFRSDDVLLPTDNFFGITGASSETPDSFEVFKFVTTANSPSVQQPAMQEQAQKPLRERSSADPAGSSDSLPEIVQDVLASSIKSSQAQFEDLHNRIQAQGHNIDSLFSEYIKSTAQLQGRIEELHSKLARFDQLRNVETKVNNLERDLAALVKDFQSKDYTFQFNDLHAGLKPWHDEITRSLPDRNGARRFIRIHRFDTH